jgi:hypothetical protein
MMSSDNVPNLPTPKSVLDQLKEWQELTAYLAAGLASGLGIFLSSGAAQIVSTVVAALVVTGGSWQLRRSHQRKKQREEQERLWEERRKQPRAAFRSLSPFEEQDELPGQDRKQQARSIAVRIVNDDFRFGIVCGDSGAGKTSLLRSEVMRQIRANGLEPVYLRSPRRLAGTASANATGCERLAAELDAFAQERIPAANCVLILDQFEEWFVEYREPEARALLGRFIAQLTKRVPPVRVVCAVRREFLMDFHDLAAELPDPTQPNNTFRVRNFTVAQAVDAVQQCALADGIAAEEAFAAALADDLADNGEVRPPELQIVCTHLAESGSLSSSRYQAEGGTAGILAHHIKNALESCREPDLGAKLLRSLCDFPTRTKRPPKTLAELAADIGRTAGSQTVAALVRTFVLARLLAEEKRKSGPDAYALLHDYLVGAVELATGDVSTQTEEANQLLRYHLAQQRGVIPLRRLRFIRAHADRPLLAQANARRLLRKSLIAPALVSGAMLCVAVMMAGGLYLMATAQVQWHSDGVIQRHWKENESGKVEYKILNEKGQIVSIDASEYKKYSRFWDAKTGDVILHREHQGQFDVSISKSGSFMIEIGFNKNNLFSLKNKSAIEIPAGYDHNFSDDEKYISYYYSVNHLDANYIESSKYITIAMWSVELKKILHEIQSISVQKIDSPSRIGRFKFSYDGDRLVACLRENNTNSIVLYNTISGEKIYLLKDTKYCKTSFVLHDMTRKVYLVSTSGYGEKTIKIYSLEDGSFIGEKKIAAYKSLKTNKGQNLPYRRVINMPSPDNDSDPKNFNSEEEFISRNGRYLICKTEKQINIISIPDMKDLINENIKIIKLFPDIIVSLKEIDNTKIWNLDYDTQLLLLNISIESNDQILTSNDLHRALIFGPQRPAELWDLKEKKLLRLLTSSKDKHIQSVEFSMNDTAVVITEEGGLASLFDAKDGSPLAQHISAASVYYYDPDLRRIHLWNSDGQVIRYVEGRSYFGKFVPTKKGAQD